jgi:hypothetical protein
MRPIIAAALLAAGCASTSVQRPSDLSPGPEPTPAQVDATTRKYLATVLKDPESLRQFQITRVSPKEWQDNRWAPWNAGWLVCFEYNAKNSYGGYVGLKRGAIVVNVSRIDDVAFVNTAVPEILVPGWC